MTRLTALLLGILLLAPLASAGASPATHVAVKAPSPAGRALDDAKALASHASEGVSAAARGAGALASGLGHALASAAAAVGSLAKGALLAAGRALAALGALLGGLLARGAKWSFEHPEQATDAAGADVSLAMLLWVAKRLGAFSFLAPLYSRLAPSQMLENDARNAVYEHVKAHPGAHPSAIAETLNLGWGTVVYHLGKLEATKLVTSRNAHNRRCYFALTSDLDVDARTAVAAMSTDKARAIVDVVRASPGISQKDLSERLGISQALASWHVKRLVESGVLTVGREGRSNTLRVAGHVPVLVAA